MGACCGTLNEQESAVIETWTDKEIVHGPSLCFCINPCVNTVTVVPVTILKIHQYCLVEDTRDPSKSKYIYGPTVFRLEHAYQQIGPVMSAEGRGQGDYITVTEKDGNKRVETGPEVVPKVFGESDTKATTAINVGVNEYIVLLDKATSATRHVRGPATVYLTPSEEVVPEERTNHLVRKCVETNSTATWAERAEGQVC